MSIEITRRTLLKLGAAALATKLLSGCGRVNPRRESTRIPATSIPHDYSVPIRTLQGANILNFENGSIMNLTRGIDLGVDTNILKTIIEEPYYEVGFSKIEQNIAFLFPQSFNSSDGRRLAMDLAASELPYVLDSRQRTLGLEAGQLRYSLISVADLTRYTARVNPGLAFQGDLFRTALGFELAAAWLSLARARIASIEELPQEYPVTVDARVKLAERRSYPFTLLGIEPQYLVSIGL